MNKKAFGFGFIGGIAILLLIAAGNSYVGTFNGTHIGDGSQMTFQTNAQVFNKPFTWQDFTNFTIAYTNAPFVVTNDTRNLVFGRVSVTNLTDSGALSWYSQSYSGLGIVQSFDGKSVGGDETTIYQTLNSWGSGAGIGIAYSGATYHNSFDFPLVDMRTGNISTNADGSTNWVHDLEATSLVMVPEQAPYGDRPGYALWVVNPGHPTAWASAGQGANFSYWQSDGTNNFVDAPIWGATNTINSWDAGYLAAMHIDLAHGHATIYSNLSFGGHLISTHNGNALSQTVGGVEFLNLTQGNPNNIVTATNFISSVGNFNGSTVPLGLDVAGNGTGVGHGGNGLLLANGNTSILTMNQNGGTGGGGEIRLEDGANGEIHPQTAAGWNLGDAGSVFGYVYQKTNVATTVNAQNVNVTVGGNVAFRTAYITQSGFNFSTFTLFTTPNDSINHTFRLNTFYEGTNGTGTGTFQVNMGVTTPIGGSHNVVVVATTTLAAYTSASTVIPITLSPNTAITLAGAVTGSVGTSGATFYFTLEQIN